ncbi:unnamed protein product [Schistocephalus solidus]|uniref:CNH domain-containing protein n=1 Tax=Schistocephalus solidus TaxID=70667 RepID=A0A183T8H2_SCHSO|nr:unnamed protein product [Schistocephalus solidus]
MTIQKIEKNTGEDLLGDVEQQDASVFITELRIALPFVEMDNGRFFEMLSNLSLAPHLLEEFFFYIQDTFQNLQVLTLLKLSSVLMAFTDSKFCVGLHAEGNITAFTDLNRLISQSTANSRSPTYLLVQNTGSVTLNSEPHLGDDEAVIGPTIGIADCLVYQHVLLISPLDENIVQLMPVPGPRVHPRGLLFRRMAEEGVSQQVKVLRTRTQ